MSTVGRIALVVLVCGLALTYLYEHHTSVLLARRVSDLEKRRELLTEELDSVNTEISQLAGFTRMESLWVAQAPEPTPDVAAVPVGPPAPTELAGVR